MAWDAEEARRYAEISANIGGIAEDEADGPLRNLLLRMSAGYEELARCFRVREQNAGLRCAGIGITETEELQQANREVRDTLMKLEKQWEELAALLDEGTRSALRRD